MEREVALFTSKKLPDGSVDVKIVFAILDGRVNWINSINISGDASVRVKADIDTDMKLPLIPKVGLTLNIPSAYRTITWFGKGPQENYTDRSSAAFVGLYGLDINDFITPYIKPQENANRTDVRWMSFTGKDGKGLSVAGEEYLSMSARPWTSDQYEKADHPNELPVNDFIVVNVDLKQMGVGGNDSWTQRAFPLTQYQIRPGKYAYTFTMKPVVKK